MPKFSPGDKVWYIPDHAEDASHPDVEAGVVKRSADYHRPDGNFGYYVDYPNDGSNVSKLTYERHLEPREE